MGYLFQNEGLLLLPLKILKVLIIINNDSSWVLNFIT